MLKIIAKNVYNIAAMRIKINPIIMYPELITLILLNVPQTNSNVSEMFKIIINNKYS